VLANSALISPDGHLLAFFISREIVPDLLNELVLVIVGLDLEARFVIAGQFVRTFSDDESSATRNFEIATLYLVELANRCIAEIQVNPRQIKDSKHLLLADPPGGPSESPHGYVDSGASEGSYD
jgi:hypothetical protein